MTGQSTGSAVDRAPGEELELGSEQIAVKPADRQSFVTEQLQSLGVRLQDALETLPDAFFILDRSWRFTYLNGQAERLLRRSRAELLGKNIWEEFAQAVGTESDRSYRRAMEEGITVRFEQFYPPLGRWLSAEAHPTREGLAVYFRDVTERRKEEEGRLEQMEGWYRNLLNAAPDAMVVVNRVREIVLLNTQVERLFGYAREELLGKAIEVLVPEGLHEHPRHFAEFFAEPRALPAPSAAEFLARRKDGAEIPVEISLSPVESAEGTLVTAAIRDISVRKAAERHLAQVEARHRGLLAAAPDAMVLVNQAGEIVLVNAQAERQFGYRNDELAARQLRTLIPGMPPLLEAISAGGGEGRPLDTGHEFVGRRKDGSELPIEIMLSPLMSVEGVLLTVAIRDITTRKKAEAQLLQAMEELNRSNEELEKFAYIASHDLQEPLRMVASYTQLLSKRYKGRLDADADEFIAFAVDGAERMQRLIQDLLAYSRVGKKDGTLRDTPSEDALEQALLNLGDVIANSGALVTHDPLPRVIADDEELVQLFENLVGNAIKYQEPGGVPLVHISSVNDVGTKWTFSVKDNGLGIEAQYFERIFGMFQRLQGRAKFAGTGIGLAICKKIVEGHGGSISVQSGPGRGSTFSFSLTGNPENP